MTFATRSDSNSGHNDQTMHPNCHCLSIAQRQPAPDGGGLACAAANIETPRAGSGVWRRAWALAVLLVAGGLLQTSAIAAEFLVFAKKVDGAVLLDGQCKEPFWKDIPATVVNQGEMQLKLAFDGQFVTFCVELSEAGLPSVDLFISTPALARSMRLHSSAQVGQAERKTIGWSDDIEWGRNDGWYAPPIPIQGMVVRGNLRRPLFSTVSQREIQLDTRQFGFGEWRFFLQVSGVGSKRARLRFPDADESMPDKWATVKILPVKR